MFFFSTRTGGWLPLKYFWQPFDRKRTREMIKLLRIKEAENNFSIKSSTAKLDAQDIGKGNIILCVLFSFFRLQLVWELIWH
jgi:hypothetical protein